MKSSYTGNDPGVLGAVHLLLESLAEDHSGFVLVEVADDNSYAVFLKHKRDARTVKRNYRADNRYLRRPQSQTAAGQSDPRGDRITTDLLKPIGVSSLSESDLIAPSSEINKR